MFYDVMSETKLSMAWIVRVASLANRPLVKLFKGVFQALCLYWEFQGPLVPISSGQVAIQRITVRDGKTYCVLHWTEI